MSIETKERKTFLVDEKIDQMKTILSEYEEILNSGKFANRTLIQPLVTKMEAIITEILGADLLTEERTTIERYILYVQQTSGLPESLWQPMEKCLEELAKKG